MSTVVARTTADVDGPSAGAPAAGPAAQTFPRPRLGSIIGRLAVSLLVACVVPAVLFSVSLVVLDVWAALLAALGWCLGALAWRAVSRRPVSGLLLLTAAVLAARTVVAFASGSTFLYFLQPVVSDLVVAAVFFGSLFVARPVVALLAGDFYPMDDDVAARPRVRRLFWQLTALWAAMSLVKAVVIGWLLASQPLVTFVMAKNVVLVVLTLLAVVVTVLASVRVARQEGLLHAA